MDWNTIDSIENGQKIGQSPADSNWTVSVGKKLKMQRKLITRISLTLIANNNFTVSTVHYLLSTVQFFLSQNPLQLIFRGQWTVDKNCKLISRSGGYSRTLDSQKNLWVRSFLMRQAIFFLIFYSWIFYFVFFFVFFA